MSSSSDYDKTDIPSDISSSTQTLQSHGWPYLRLPNISTQSRAAQLIATALAAVCNDDIHIEGYLPEPCGELWDGNDLAILRMVATQIDKGLFDVETQLKWKVPHTYRDGTNWIQQVVIPALASYSKATKEKTLLALKDGENADDVLAHLDDDRAYLMCFLGVVGVDTLRSCCPPYHDVSSHLVLQSQLYLALIAHLFCCNDVTFKQSGADYFCLLPHHQCWFGTFVARMFRKFRPPPALTGTMSLLLADSSHETLPSSNEGERVKQASAAFHAESHET
ncbi:uncharacterized protein F5147DRAFT_652844 [Suillus discolor]|uniref:Uncharacterized protein n=1 Tax=Suillus discolor TaxID=1912936 RepID=A0A9P7F7M6_9AGAM|nr:uncharacterized protein F5147DRAFT_652844 [Suillus discolor]KAG2108491.1 hypothetical protein F5147DRAFT_652844 [Suillus discolor]